ncbi:MAG: pilus assembly protein TadG-related protein [bacterium]
MRILSWSRQSSRALLAAARRRRGATLVMMSILLIAFLGVGAIAADIGRFYAVVTELQTAADAGALAGALKLQRTEFNPEEPDVDSAVVTFVNSTNRADGAQIVITTADVRTAIYTPPKNSVTKPLDFDVVARRANAVMVTVSAAPVGVFSQLIGRAANLPLSRTGVAWVANLGGRCVRPWAFPYRKLYEAVEGITGVPDPAPDLEPRNLVKFLNRDPDLRMFVVLGAQVRPSPTDPDDGNWAGFNFTGALGQPAFVDALLSCVPNVLDVQTTIAAALPSQAGSYVAWSNAVIVAPGGGICYRQSSLDAGCYPAPGAAAPGVAESVAWSDTPTSNALPFRYVGDFIVTCYFDLPAQVCGHTKPGYANKYPLGTIIGVMAGIKSRPLKSDDVLGVKPSNVQRIILVR